MSVVVVSFPHVVLVDVEVEVEVEDLNHVFASVLALTKFDLLLPLVEDPTQQGMPNSRVSFLSQHYEHFKCKHSTGVPNGWRYFMHLSPEQSVSESTKCCPYFFFITCSDPFIVCESKSIKISVPASKSENATRLNSLPTQLVLH